ncbi:MAG TPA: DUF2125 domain-containing protein [Azospirillaceae bacterium]|nr:DUF2125 domain-containing protein [Azospirillaceae bacterium]
MRRLTVLAAVLAGLAIAAYCGWWWFAARTLERELLSRIERERAAGTDIAYDALSIGGFPLNLNADIRGPRMTRRDGLAWMGRAVSLSARPWAVTTVDVVLRGPQNVTLANPDGRSVVELSAQGGKGRLEFRIDGSLEGGSIVLDRLDAAFYGPAGREMTTAVQGEAWFTLPPPGVASPRLVTAVFDDVNVPLAASTPLGPAIRRLSVQARVAGPLPSGFDRAALNTWVERGGQVLVDAAHVLWGPVAMAADGILGLDATLQPSAQLTARVTGFNEAINAARRVGWLRDNVELVRGFLNLMARPTGEGGRPEITTSVHLQDRWLSIGPMRLVRVPPVEWAG